MTYTKQTWADGPAGATPITAARLAHIEDGVFDAAATADVLTDDVADQAAALALIGPRVDAAEAAVTGKASTAYVDSAIAGAGTQAPAVDTVVRRDGNAAFSAARVTVTALSPATADELARRDYVDAQVATRAASTHTHGLADLPAGTTITVLKTGSTWPARPTSRADVVVAWKGADPSPGVVSSGTAGMLDNVDYRLVTP